MNFYVWFGLTALLIAGALVFSMPELVLLALASAVALVVSLVPGLDSQWVVQAAAAFVSGFFIFKYLRTHFHKFFRGKEIREDFSEESGREVEVLEAVTPDNPGRIKLHGTTWTAISIDDRFQPGDKAIVLEKEGMTYTIGKLEKEVVWKS